jgi:hypothetical protein
MYLPCGFDGPAKGNAWASIYQLDGKFAFSRDQDDTVEAHYSGFERQRPCACMSGVVYIGHLVEAHGEEVEVVEAVPCRRCAGARA